MKTVACILLVLLGIGVLRESSLNTTLPASEGPFTRGELTQRAYEGLKRRESDEQRD